MWLSRSAYRTSTVQDGPGRGSGAFLSDVDDPDARTEEGPRQGGSEGSLCLSLLEKADRAAGGLDVTGPASGTSSTEALTWLRWITGKLGLDLNEAKTRVCAAERESFDFLGYTLGPMVFRRTGKTYVGVTPSKKRVKRFKKSLRTELHVANHAPLDEVVAAVNRKLRGWSRYFSVGMLEPAYRTVDRYTEALFRQFLVRRHKVPGRGNRPFSNRYLYEELGLVRLEDRRRMSRLHALT